MSFAPFTTADSQQTAALAHGDTTPNPLGEKMEGLRQDLCDLPEFQLDFFRKRIVRRPRMHGSGRLVLGKPKVYDGHWFFFVVGGDQDQVQFNVGMFDDYIRVGLGFMIGRQVAPKMPAVQVLQSFLGTRPPLSFRDALYNCVERISTSDTDELLHRLEIFVVGPDEETVFVFGKYSQS
jgi:hypothetical protein